jgi:hypothetical protein
VYEASGLADQAEHIRGYGAGDAVAGEHQVSGEAQQ